MLFQACAEVSGSRLKAVCKAICFSLCLEILYRLGEVKTRIFEQILEDAVV